MRDIGLADLGWRRRVRDDVLWRRHHRSRYGLVLSIGCHGGGLMGSLVAPPRIWVVVDPRMSSQLV